MQAYLRAQSAGTKKGLKQAFEAKARMDYALLQRRSDICAAAVLEFSGATCVATTGTISPDFDAQGKRLQVLHDLSASIEWLFVAIDIAAEGPCLVFCWLRDARKAEQYVRSYLELPEEKLAALLPQWIFYRVGNTYFLLTGGWACPGTTAEGGDAAQESNAYYSTHSFLASSITPWKLKRIRTHGLA